MTTSQPAATLPEFDPAVVIDVDVREDLRSGREPLARILGVAKSVPPGRVLHVRAPFQPVPLYNVLAQQGFAHHSERFSDNDWSTWFWRSDAPPAPAAPTIALLASVVPGGVIDLRALPAPEPLVTILARVTRSDEPFEVMLAFDPPILDAILAQQGCRVERVSVSADGARLKILPAEPGE
jgi:hypothetical protein